MPILLSSMHTKILHYLSPQSFFGGLGISFAIVLLVASLDTS